VVVDNSEQDNEAQKSRSELPPEVIFRVSPENMGFGHACNLAFKGFSGEGILLINHRKFEWKGKGNSRRKIVRSEYKDELLSNVVYDIRRRSDFFLFHRQI
jgi:hypothetical protein